MNRRAINKVADFMNVVKRADAKLTIAFQDKGVSLDTGELVEKTAEKLSDVQRQQITWTVTGILRE